MPSLEVQHCTPVHHTLLSPRAQCPFCPISREENFTASNTAYCDSLPLIFLICCTLQDQILFYIPISSIGTHYVYTQGIYNYEPSTILPKRNQLHGSMSSQQCTFWGPSTDAHVLLSRDCGMWCKFLLFHCQLLPYYKKSILMKFLVHILGNLGCWYHVDKTVDRQ